MNEEIKSYNNENVSGSPQNIKIETVGASDLVFTYDTMKIVIPPSIPLFRLTEEEQISNEYLSRIAPTAGSLGVFICGEAAILVIRLCESGEDIDFALYQLPRYSKTS